MPLGDCFFGVPQSDFFGWTVLEEIPAEVTGFRFYLGSDCEGLIQGFANSKFTEQVERLTVGSSSFNMGMGRNYENLTQILSTAKFPNLKVLGLGVWDLFSNSHGMYGSIGNITTLLDNMPNLEKLWLYGAFDLDAQVTLSKLSELNVTLDDHITGVNGGLISQVTLSNLLESNLPSLQDAFIDLDCEDNDMDYQMPNSLIEGKSWPRLKKIEFTGGYAQGEIDKILKSEFVRENKIVVHYDEPS